MTCSCCADMNVGYVLDEAQLTRYFSQFGTVTDCYLPVRTMRAHVCFLVFICWTGSAHVCPVRCGAKHVIVIACLVALIPGSQQCWAALASV